MRREARNQVLWFLAAGCQMAAAQDTSLEELLNTEITSVGRKSQNVANAPAPAFVISAEDIRRSGAQALPDVLRMVPGIEVAQIDSGRYAVSARGFNGRFANKLQVLVDGRSIYRPTFSGVMWENDPVALADIERIEVIRGPGAAMWGVNAVSGVINIISKHSRDQAGGLVAPTFSSRGQHQFRGRYGGAAGPDTTWKLSFQGRRAGPSTQFAANVDSQDRLHNDAMDFRLDSRLGDGELTLWANAGESSMDDLVVAQVSPLPPLSLSAGSYQQRSRSHTLASRYRWLTATGVESSVQASFQDSSLDMSSMYREDRQTWDLDYQGRLAVGRHDLLWGLSHRSSRDDALATTLQLSFSPVRFTQRTTGVFLQDDLTLVPQTLQLGLGGRWDDSNLGGATVAANGTLMWTPTRADTVWLRYARAPRMPSRAEQHVSVIASVVPNDPLPVALVSSAAGQTLKPERMTGVDLGYRTLLAARLSLDATVYRYRYRDRVSGSLGTLDTTAYYPYALLQHVDLCNCSSGTVSGLELAADWLAAPNWRLQASYTLTRVRMDDTDNAIAQANGLDVEAATPRYYGSLRSQWNLPQHRQVDAWLRGSAGFDRLSTPYPYRQRVPGYVTLDLRYSQPLRPGVEVAVIGRNLIGARRTEFISDYVASVPVEIERSLFVSVRWSL